MKLKSSWLLLLLAWAASSCGEVPPPERELAPVAVRATRQQGRSTDKVLILDSSVSGELNSREAQAVRAYSPTTQIDVLKPAEWRLLTAEQFMEYRTIIIGDAACQSGEDAFQAAVDTRRRWGAIIDGDVVIVSTNPTSNLTPRLVDNAIQVALDSAQYRTGMYISLGCAFQNAPPSTVVTLLEPFGHFKVEGVPDCGTGGHFFRMLPATLSRGITDGQLPGGEGCVARSVFTSYPDHNFAFAAIATGTPEAPIPGERTYIDYYVEEDVETEFVGTPYVLVKGATARSAGCGDPDHTPPDEECDSGDNGNGQPAPPGEDPENTCSHSCHHRWCGDGVIDEEFGEECDQGIFNGRSDDAEGRIGTCSGFCMIPDIGLPNQPPVALCKDVTVVATNTCGVPADINDGSHDPDGDLVGCVQNPPGPYLIGSTRVTLTCRDRSAQFGSCTGMVTVTDLVAPTVTLEGPASDVMECTQGATYPDQSATAHDICEGPLPVTTSGSVDMGSPGSYSLTYSATDFSGNVGTATRPVAVNDTLPPTVTLSGSNPLQHECGAPFTDPGALGTDQCVGTLVPATSGTVDDRVPGSYSLRYSVSDPTGHSAARDRVVTVSDTLPPSITVREPLEDTLECGSPYVDPGATAEDMCAGPLSVTTTQTGRADRPGTFTLSYSAIDPAGHGATSPVNRTVHVVDEMPPTLTLVDPVIQMMECATPWDEPGAMASDACFGDLTSDIIRSGSVNTGTPGSYPLSYNVTDPAGHSATPRQRTVNVQDTLAPSITIRGSLSVQLQCDHVPYVDPGATAADSCAGDLTGAVQRVGSVDTGLPGSYTLRYRVADPSGNQTTSVEARTVSVVDDQPPTIALNGPSSAGHECGSAYDDLGATANDVCAGDLTGSITRTGAVDTGVPGAYTLRYTVTDPANLSASTQRAVNVQDTLAPTLSLRGPGSELVECGPGYVDPGATAMDICAGNLDAQVQVSGAADPTMVGDYNVTYTVSDFAGNAATPVNRRVQVRDTTAPTIALNGPSSTGHECGSAYDDSGATASDVCAGDLTGSITRTGSVDTGAPGSYTLRYTVTDPANLSASTQRAVNVQDTLAPTLSLRGPASELVECSLSYVDPGATAMDICAGNLDAQVQVSGAADSDVVGDYNVTYTVSDSAGNAATPVTRRVQVRDTTAPTLSIIEPVEAQVQCGTPYADPGARAMDTCAGDLTSAIVATRSGDSRRPGSFTITYSVQDPSGNLFTSPVVRTVNVRDDLPPTLTLVEPATQTVECATPWNEPGITASDLCFGDLTSAITRTGIVSTGTPGDYTLMYSVEDGAGNSASSVSRTVQVRDTLAPSITIEGPLTQSAECGTAYADPGATARDACAGDLTAALEIVGTVSTGTPGSYTLRYRVADLSGNQTTSAEVRTVTVVDEQPPTLELLGSASMRVECGSPYDDAGAKARDACAGDLSERITRAGTVNPAMPGSYTISYSVSDPASNRVTVLREVSVTDTLPPSIVCPEPLVVETPEDTLATVSLRAATATDVCSQAEVSMPAQTEFPVGTTELTYTATDQAGNSAKCTTTVTVLAIAPPIPDLDRALIGGGNGCASTGGGPSSLAMIGLGVLASLLARKRTRAILPVLAMLLLGSKAVAQPAGIPPFELERLMLNPSGRGSLLVGTGELLPHGEYRLSLTSHYENDPLLLVLNGTQVGTVVQHRATMHLAAAYGLWGWVELGAQVPVVLLQRGDDLTDRGIGTPRGGLAAGTPLFSAQLKLLSQREDDLVDLSLGVHAGPAVGSAEALAREFRGTPTVMVGRRFEHLQTAIDAGVMFRRRTILSPDTNVQDEIGHALRLGATLSSLGEGLRGELAVLGSVPLKREGSSVEALAGARYPLSEAFEVYGLAGLGFGTAAGTPDFRVLLGIALERPRPPPQVEVAKYEPELPLPMDSDADGVLDEVDRCPTVPGLEGLQGCPDDDGDGVEDGVDRCLGEAGPVDRRGCPERDSDGDGLVDGKDSCPTEAGPLDRVGCPVPDKDHDMVEDLRDNCPDEAGPPDNQGCPEEEKQLVVIQTDRIAIKDTVHFDFNKATIQPRSYGLLDQVARVLREHPEIVSVSVEGHTDGVGPAEYNRGLSQRRAEAVRDYLARKDVAPERMQAQGFGEDRPVQSNATSAGRAANRRVEFITRSE